MYRFLLSALPLLIAAPCLAQEAKPKDLAAYVGKDLRQLDQRGMEQFRDRLAALTGDKPEHKEWGNYEAWWLKPFGAGDAAWLFLEAYPGYEVPDVSGVQIHVFDKHWKRLVKQSFPTGYRFLLKEVVLIKDNPLNQELLVAKATSSGPFIVEGGEKHPAFEQGDFQRQYYALLGDHFVMVRLEDDERRLAQNHYRWSAPTKGPAAPKRTRDEWIRSLGSANRVEQRATLVWLSGAHLPSTVARREDVNQESAEDSKLFEAVRDAAQTKHALQQMANSDNAWVREYAAFTLRAIAEQERRRGLILWRPRSAWEPALRRSASRASRAALLQRAVHGREWSAAERGICGRAMTQSVGGCVSRRSEGTRTIFTFACCVFHFAFPARRVTPAHFDCV